MTTAVRLRPQAKATMARRIRARRQAFATRLAGSLRRFFAGQRRRVLARLYADAHLHAKALAPTGGELLPPEEDRLLQLAIRPFVDAGIVSSAELAQLLVGGVLDPNSYSAGVQRLLDQAGSRIVRINDATRRAVQDALQEGHTAGYSLYQLANGVAADGFRGIADTVEQLYAGRAEAIARTEMGWASQAASQAQWRELGVQQQEIIDGEDWDEECSARNGTTVSIEEDVELLHPNCTVVSLPVVGGEGAPEEQPVEESAPDVSTDLPLIEWADRIGEIPPFADQSDPVLGAIADLQGFNGLPELVSREELDRFSAAGEREVWRGVRQEEFVSQFKEGDYFPGRGVYGDGTYVTYGENGLGEARGYAGQGIEPMEMVLKEGSRVIDYDELQTLMAGEHDALYEWGRSEVSRIVAENTGEETTRLVLEFSRKLDIALRITDDPGLFAAARGYDAIDVARREFMVVLNRTALRVVR